MGGAMPLLPFMLSLHEQGQLYTSDTVGDIVLLGEWLMTFERIIIPLFLKIKQSLPSKHQQPLTS
jgi:hypothetical protein